MPLITLDRQLCLWSMPKTASSFAECVMSEERGGYRVGDQHDPARMAEELNLLDTPAHIGTVRDPWSWYGSLWAHAFHHPLQGGRSFPRRSFGAVLAYSKGKTDLKSFLFGATHLDELDLPYEWLGAIWIPRRGGPPPQRGLWSWAVAYMYDGGRVTHLIDGNRPEEALRALGFAAAQPPRNTSAGTYDAPILTDWRAQFDDEMVGWVADADEGMREALGYDVAPFAVSAKGPLVPYP